MFGSASSRIGLDKNDVLFATDNGQNDRVSNNLYPVFKIDGSSYTSFEPQSKNIRWQEI